MNIHGKYVVLRAVEPEDIEMIRNLTNSPDYESQIVGYTLSLSKKDQEEWYQSYKVSMEIMRYTIETKEDGPVGMIGLGHFDWKNGTASGLGMRIAKKDLRQRGLATDAWMALMRYAFDELRLNRINGSALEHNKASLRVCEKVGFKVEGVQREAIYKNGQFHNVVMLGCTKSDYYKLIQENKYWEE